MATGSTQHLGSPKNVANAFRVGDVVTKVEHQPYNL